MIKHRLRRHTLKTEDGLGDWNYVLRTSGGFSMDAGYVVYAPYIPLIVNTTMYNPILVVEDFFIPQRAIASRYTTTINSDFYRTIDISGDIQLSV